MRVCMVVIDDRNPDAQRVIEQVANAVTECGGRAVIDRPFQLEPRDLSTGLQFRLSDMTETSETGVAMITAEVEKP